jgi:hypothetical protein
MTSTLSYSIPTPEYADPDVRAKHLASLIATHAKTAKKVVVEVGGETLTFTPERVLAPAQTTQTFVEKNITTEEYRIQKELVQTTGGKAVKAGHCPYVYDARADGEVEYTIPLGVPKWSAGDIKTLQHNHQKKWSVQARLRKRLADEGKTLNADV